MHLLIIGNSHSVDAFHYLYQVFQEQQPHRNVALGVLYFGGCSISKHLHFALCDKALYTYYKNTDGTWKSTEKVNMVSVLEDQPWDMVMFQAAKSDLDETLNESDRRDLERFIRRYVADSTRFLWHTSWPSPNDEAFFSDTAVNPPPEGYKENLMALYNFDPVTQFTLLTRMAKTHILPDRHYTGAVCTGAAILYAHRKLGIPQAAIWRDYTHLSDYGRLLAAYALYTQLTEKPVSQIQLTAIPQDQRHSYFTHLGDFLLTEQIKREIMLSANHALNDPWNVPE